MFHKQTYTAALLVIFWAFFISCRTTEYVDRRTYSSGRTGIQNGNEPLPGSNGNPYYPGDPYDPRNGNGSPDSPPPGSYPPGTVPPGTYPPGNYPPGVDPNSPWQGCGQTKYCDKGGGKVDYPTQMPQRRWYSNEDVLQCMDQVSRRGFPTQGPWFIQNHELALSIGGQTIAVSDSFRGQISGPRILMLKTLNIATAVNYQLMDPLTVYCIKSDSKLALVTYSSCYPHNIAFLKNKKWRALTAQIIPRYCAGQYLPWYGKPGQPGSYPPPTK